MPGRVIDAGLGPDDDDEWFSRTDVRSAAAAAGVGHVVLSGYSNAGASVRGVRHGMEHVLDPGSVSGLQPPVALDLVPRCAGWSLHEDWHESGESPT